MNITVIILISISITCWVCGFYFLFRIPVCRTYAVQRKYPGVSIIIPARDEEYTIGPLLDSINNQQFRADEVIVVDDGSADRTGEISKKKGATVIESKSLPSGWLGKPWACYQGAQQASGEVLIFLDADTQFEENGLQNVMDTYMHLYTEDDADGKIVMSIAPFHKVKKLYEELSAVFNLIMLGSMNAFTPFKSIRTNGLFGPSLIVHREDYYAVNGHESVKNRILENVFMAAKFREKNIRLKCLGGRGSLSFRMYPNGIRDLINGWTKAFASGSSQTSFSALLPIIFWITGGFLISIFLVNSIVVNQGWVYWVLLYTGFFLQMYWMLKRIGSFKIMSALFYPFHLVFYCVVFFRSLIFQKSNKSIQWKSRAVTS